MEKKEITPILTYFDKAKFDTELDRLEKYVIRDNAKSIEESFRKVGLGKLNEQYLNAVLSNNLSIVERDIKIMMLEHINPEFFREEYLRNIDTKITIIETAVNKLFEDANLWKVRYLFEYLSLNDAGEIVITEADKERLKNFYSVFVTTEEGIERYKLHLAACKAINRFYAKIKDMGTSGPLELFATVDDQEVVPQDICYE